MYTKMNQLLKVKRIKTRFRSTIEEHRLKPNDIIRCEKDINTIVYRINYNAAINLFFSKTFIKR